MSYTDPQIGTLTITGDPARFVATERVPVSELSMDFEPVQDLHGYEYPWPAGGGTNLFDSSLLVEQAGWYIIELTLSPNTKYTMSSNMSDEKTSELPVYFKTENVGGGSSSLLVYSGHPVTLTSDANGHLYISERRVSGTDVFSNYQYQVEIGESVSAWSPYENICPITGRDSVTVYVSPEPAVVDGTEEHEIEFGQTVYEGTMTINEDGSGQIVSKYASISDASTLNWSVNASGGFYTQGITNIKWATSSSVVTKTRSSSYKPITYTNTYYNSIDMGIANSYNGNAVYITDSRFTTASELKENLNGVQIFYELDEPVTLQLDPIEITTLIGLNYVWTSDHNMITISFPYNKEVQPMALTYEHCWTYPKAYIDKLEARIAALETAAEAAAAEANTAAAPADTRETVAEDITVTEEPETQPVTKKGGK